MSLETFMKIMTWLGVLGIPSLFTILVWFINHFRKSAKNLKILMEAQQAQMRGELLKDFHFFKKQGYISDIELKEWEHQYLAYHALGENGVLDNRYEQLLALPNEPPTNI